MSRNIYKCWQDNDLSGSSATIGHIKPDPLSYARCLSFVTRLQVSRRNHVRRPRHAYRPHGANRHGGEEEEGQEVRQEVRSPLPPETFLIPLLRRSYRRFAGHGPRCCPDQTASGALTSAALEGEPEAQARAACAARGGGARPCEALPAR